MRFVPDGMGERIRSRREDLGLTQSEVAGFAGCLRTSIIGIEKGRAGCSLRVLMQLCDVLEVSADWLLFGEED